jgi:exodeoxyribonuclease V beta subunit
VSSSSTATVSAWQSFPAGARYGTLLHDLLQYQAEHAWPLADAGATGQDLAWQQLLQRKADWLQLPSDAQALLQPWLQTIVSTPLPLQAADAPMQSLGAPLVLQTLAAHALWAEMEFSLPVGQLSSSELDAHIQRHVLPGLERPSLQNNVMQGMLSGFMDLVLQHDGRYWVLDYKSNLLADYQAPQLNSAILGKRYEVQYVLYTLALHRLLQSRLPNYHYEQHMGGAVYLFLRGIDTPSAGVHCLRPPWALIDLLDQRFAKALP